MTTPTPETSPTPESSAPDDLTLALELAAEADALTMQRFGAVDLRVQTKPDMTPATDADLDAEKLLRARLAELRPDDSVFGEEFGGTREFRGRQWVVDPIDGTKNFVRGVPVWATLIALLVDGVPAVGVISAPALGRRWWAAEGRGAFASFGDSTRRLSVSEVTSLDAASLSYSDLTTGWEDARSRFVELTDAVWRVRGYGDFSGRTAWSPRARWTSRWSRRSSCGISRRSTSWSARPGARSRIWRDGLARTAEARWPPTVPCTRRCWRR